MNPVLTDQGIPPLIPSFPFEEPSLTAREVEILEWVSRGKTNNQIGLILDMSPRTVAKHLTRINTKFRVRSRTEAAVHFVVRNQQKLQVRAMDLPDIAG